MRGSGVNREGPAILTDARSQQRLVILSLANMLGRNRLALVALAASVTSRPRNRARQSYSESAAVQWLARNALNLRRFLASLRTLSLLDVRAGYRKLGRALCVLRVRTAPRRLQPLVQQSPHAFGSTLPLCPLVVFGRVPEPGLY